MSKTKWNRDQIKKKRTHEVDNIGVQLGIPTSQPKFNLKRGVAENTCVSQSQMENPKQNKMKYQKQVFKQSRWVFFCSFFYHPCGIQIIVYSVCVWFYLVVRF